MPLPGKKQYEAIVVGNDKKIWKTSDPKTPYEVGTTLASIALTANQKTLFAGVGEPNRPGSIHIYKMPFEKINEV